MKKLTAILIAAILAISLVACSEPDHLTPTVKEIGQEMLITLDDMRIGKVADDVAIEQMTPLSERLYDEIERLEGDEEHAARYVDQRINLSFAGLSMDLIPIFEVARDELAEKLGEPTKYDRKDDLRELVESELGETFADSEWVD